MLMSATETHFTLNYLKKRGWTQGLVDRLLGPPDKVEPLTSTGQPNRLWEKARVQEAEKLPECRKRQDQIRAKWRAEAQGDAAKRGQAAAYVATVEIPIPRTSVEELYKRGLEQYETRLGGKGFAWREYDLPRFRDRICLAYLTKLLTPVIKRINEIAGEQNGRELRLRTVLGFLDKIAAIYPSLADECDNQREVIYSKDG